VTLCKKVNASAPTAFRAEYIVFHLGLWLDQKWPTLQTAARSLCDSSDTCWISCSRKSTIFAANRHVPWAL